MAYRAIPSHPIHTLTLSYPSHLYILALTHTLHAPSHTSMLPHTPPCSLTYPPCSLTHPPRSLTHPPRSLTHPPRSLTHCPCSLTHCPCSLTHNLRSLTHCLCSLLCFLALTHTHSHAPCSCSPLKCYTLRWLHGILVLLLPVASHTLLSLPPLCLHSLLRLFFAPKPCWCSVTSHFCGVTHCKSV